MTTNAAGAARGDAGMRYHQPEILTDREDRWSLGRCGLVVVAAVILLWVGLYLLTTKAHASIGDNEDWRTVSRHETSSVAHHQRAARSGRAARPTPPGRRPAAPIAAAKRERGVSLAGVVPTLADKARQIVSACGSVIVSAVSRRANRSNHGIGRAVDISGNPQCIYASLKGWPGGVSTDYWSVRCDGRPCPHVHISFNPGGMEWGVRFVHRDPFGNGKARRVRLAHVQVRQ